MRFQPHWESQVWENSKNYNLLLTSSKCGNEIKAKMETLGLSLLPLFLIVIVFIPPYTCPALINISLFDFLWSFEAKKKSYLHILKWSVWLLMQTSKYYLLSIHLGWIKGIKGAWVAQSTKCPTLDFGSGHDLRVIGLSPKSLLGILGFSLSLSLSK